MQGDHFRFPAGRRSAYQAAHTTARSAQQYDLRESRLSPQTDARRVLLIIRGEIARGRDDDDAAALACLMSFVRARSLPIELLALQWSGEAPAFTIACRFENRKARRAFATSAAYCRWLRAVLRLGQQVGSPTR
jgi:hypothetical protein